MTTQFHNTSLPESLSLRIQTATAQLSRELYQKNALERPFLAAELLKVMIEAEAEAWESGYPHLLLPDLVEAKVARLLLAKAEPVESEVCSLALAA